MHAESTSKTTNKQNRNRRTDTQPDCGEEPGGLVGRSGLEEQLGRHRAVTSVCVQRRAHVGDTAITMDSAVG